MKDQSLYAKDGVNTTSANSLSKKAYKVGIDSYKNSPAVIIVNRTKGHFRGLRGFVVKLEFIAVALKYRLGISIAQARKIAQKMYWVAGVDGAGTKTMLTDAARNHFFSFWDPWAMVGSDQTRYGALPVIFMDVLDVSTLGNPGDEVHELFCSMFDGLAKIAKEQKFVIYNGETAELGVAVGSDNHAAVTKYNIAGTVIGIGHPAFEITGKNMKPGMPIVAICENGFRSNGVSSVRKAFKMLSNDDINFYSKVDPQLLKQAAEPSVLYDYFLSEMNGWYPKEYKGRYYPHGVAHISGGGIVEKFGEDLLFRNKLSAVLDNLNDLPEPMRVIAEARGFSDEEFYKTLNGGHAALLVIDPNAVDEYIARGKKQNLQIRHIGTTTETKPGELPVLTIHSKLHNGNIVRYTQQK